MLLLDTNVVSELMRAVPAANVVTWVNEQPSSSLFLSAISRIRPRSLLAEDLGTIAGP